MSAKEMFEKLGFIVSDNLTKGAKISINNEKAKYMDNVTAIKVIDRYYDEDDEYVEEENEKNFRERINKYAVMEIHFSNDIFGKTITLRKKIIQPNYFDENNFTVEFNGFGIVCIKETKFAPLELILDLELIQAINQQIKELGWYE